MKPVLSVLLCSLYVFYDNNLNRVSSLNEAKNSHLNINLRIIFLSNCVNVCQWLRTTCFKYFIENQVEFF